MTQKAIYKSLGKTFIFFICSTVLCIVAGLLLSFKYSGSAFFNGVSVMRNVSFDSASFGEAFSNAVRSDFLFCFSVILFSGGFPTVFASPLLFMMRLFSVGATIGLAARCCTFEKAVCVFISVFFSNVLSVPLYCAIVFLSFKYFEGIRYKGFYSSNLTKRYFFFVAKIFLIFGVMCIAQLFQCGFGILLLKIAAN